MTVYTYTGVTTPCTCILGFATPKNTFASLQDILTVPYTRDTLVDILGTEPIVYSDGESFELILPETYTGPTQFIAITPETRTNKIIVDLFETMHSWKEYPYLCNFSHVEGAGRAMVVARIQAANPPINNTRMSSPQDRVCFYLPLFKYLVKLYSTPDTAGAEEQTNLFKNEDPLLCEDEEVDPDDDEESASAGTQAITSYQDLAVQIDLQHIPLNVMFSYFDCIHYKDAIKLLGNNFPVAYIEGDPNNNRLEIQDNEKDFYDAMCRLIEYGICFEKGIYSRTELDAAVAANQTSKIVNAFLQDVAEDAFSLNYRHTGTVLTSSFDSDANSDEIGCSIYGAYRLEQRTSQGERTIERVPYAVCASLSDIHNLVAGFSKVKAFVTTHIINTYAWAECVIRLLRWGARKPSCLIIPTHSTDHVDYLDLRRLTFTTFDGMRASLQPCEDETGASLEIASVVVAGIDSQPEDAEGLSQLLGMDPNIFSSVIYGFELITRYKGLSEVAHTFIDIFDMYSYIKDGLLKVKGLSFTEGTGFHYTGNDTVPVRTLEDCCSEQGSEFLPNDIVIGPKTLELVQSVRQRIQNLQPSRINTMKLLMSLYLIRSAQRITDAKSIIAIPDTRERMNVISRSFQSTGMTPEEIACNAIVLEACKPILDFSLQYAEDAQDVQALLNAVSNYTPTVKPTIEVNPAFASGITRCTSFYEVTQEGKHVIYIGRAIHFSQQKQKDISVWYFWNKDEYTVAMPSLQQLSYAAYIAKFISVYNQKSQEGKLQLLLQNSFICCTDSTIQNSLH